MKILCLLLVAATASAASVCSMKDKNGAIYRNDKVVQFIQSANGISAGSTGRIISGGFGDQPRQRDVLKIRFSDKTSIQIDSCIAKAFLVVLK